MITTTNETKSAHIMLSEEKNSVFINMQSNIDRFSKKADLAVEYILLRRDIAFSQKMRLNIPQVLFFENNSDFDLIPVNDKSKLINTFLRKLRKNGRELKHKEENISFICNILKPWLDYLPTDALIELLNMDATDFYSQ